MPQLVVSKDPDVPSRGVRAAAYRVPTARSEFRSSNHGRFRSYKRFHRLLDAGLDLEVTGLNVVVERELVRCRVQVVRRELVIPLVADPGRDQVGRENASCGEVFVIVLEAVDHGG